MAHFFAHFFRPEFSFKVEYFENSLMDFNYFGLTLQDFERPLR